MYDIKTMVERTFSSDTKEDRNEWIALIKRVKAHIQDDGATKSGNTIMEIPNNTNPFTNNQGATSRKGDKKQKITFDNFEFLKVLGKGGFGKVILCREKSSNSLYAMKILKKKFIKSKGLKGVERTFCEKRVLQKSKHPFVLSLKYSFTTQERLCLVTEYVNGGDMYFHLRKYRCLSEDATRFYSAEISCALNYLHQRGIIYRDLKPENVLLDSNGHIRVADFEMCKEDIYQGHTTATVVGTPEYYPPEMILGKEYDQSLDWWTLGTLIYELITGGSPFNGFMDIISDSTVQFPGSMKISSRAKSLIMGLLDKDPKRRLYFDRIQKHEFFKTIDWEALERKEITPPFTPLVSNETDTRNFEIEFTGESVELTPPDQDDQYNLNDNTHVVDLEDSFAKFSFYGSGMNSSSAIKPKV